MALLFIFILIKVYTFYKLGILKDNFIDEPFK